MGLTHEVFTRLGEVTCPVTIAVGHDEGGFPSPPAFGPPAVDALPHGRLVRHPELGHFGPLEDPAVIADDIRATFDRTAPAS